MGIKNLPTRLAEAGKIKIGIKGEMITSAQGKEFRPPQKLDHFLLVTTERDEKGDYIVDTVLQNAIIESGNGLVNNEGKLVGVPIRMLYEDIDSNFPTSYTCYSSGKLVCHGDGEIAHKRLDDFQKDHPCPCHRLEHGYEGKDKCKPTGKLNCIIDEAGLFGQAHVFRTTGYNTVTGLLSGLKLIQTATKGRLAGLPLMLTLTAKQTTTPSGTNTTVYIVGICYRGSMSDLRQDVLAMLSEEQKYLINMDQELLPSVSPQPTNSEEEKEFVEEFFPDAVTVNQKTDKPTAPVNTAAEKTKEEVQPNAEDKQEDPQTFEEKQEKQVAKDENVKSSDKLVDISGRMINQGGPYASLYNRMLEAMQHDNRDDAMKLAKRITKDFLKIFFERERPDIVFPGPGATKKPEYLEKLEQVLAEDEQILFDQAPVIESGSDDPDDDDGEEEHPFLAELAAMTDQKAAADAMTDFFNPIPINRTLSIPELVASARKMIGNTKGEIEQEQPQEEENFQKTESEENTQEESAPEEFPRKFDTESGPVEKDQLRKLVQLKNDLVNLKVLDPSKWCDHVGYFLDADGRPVGTAKVLSRKQADTFIAMLTKELLKYTDDVPF